MKLLCAFLALTVASPSAAQSSSDKAAIRKIIQDEISTWNKGDAVGYSKDFAKDGTFTNIRGQFFTGYDGFLEQHQVIFDGVFKKTTLKQRVVTKKDGAWRIVTYHNTDVKPGIPFTEP